ncbi:MAG: GGDEF domain-containing protein [Burkholderiaceae bacterium]|nr:GGDEF domain-containing protein [Roseateles sp.]MBV8470044.1 GGDEF domain-containing protein [Burkholderiaceae bacterium]
MTASPADLLALEQLPGRDVLLLDLEQATRAAHASKRPLSVLALDVDHFKDYQDQHALHEASQALARLAKELQAHLPPSGALYHLSGDEFIVLLPDVALPDAAALAETLRADVADALATEQLTVTLGVASTPAHTDWSARGLLSLADARMTFAKKRLNPHHNLIWAGALPSDWYLRLDIEAKLWPQLETHLA